MEVYSNKLWNYPLIGCILCLFLSFLPIVFVVAVLQIIDILTGSLLIINLGIFWSYGIDPLIFYLIYFSLYICLLIVSIKILLYTLKIKKKIENIKRNWLSIKSLGVVALIGSIVWLILVIILGPNLFLKLWFLYTLSFGTIPFIIGCFLSIVGARKFLNL